MNPDPPDNLEPGGIDLAPGVTAPPHALRIQFSRSSGPGGQHVNKLNTRAELWLTLGAIRGMSPRALDRLRDAAGRRLTRADQLHLVAEGHRSQEGNRQDALDRLREMIVAAQREPKRRRKSKPTAASRRKRLESKRRRGQVKARRSGRAPE